MEMFIKEEETTQDELGQMTKDVHFVMRVYTSQKIVKGASKNMVFIIPYKLMHTEIDGEVVARRTIPLSVSDVQNSNSKLKDIDYLVSNDKVIIPLYIWDEAINGGMVFDTFKTSEDVIKCIKENYTTTDIKRNMKETLKGFWIKNFSAGSILDLADILNNIITRTKQIA